MRKARSLSLSRSVPVLIAVIAPVLSGQTLKTATTISGTAVDEKGAPVQASVTIMTQGFTQSKFSAQNGAFVFSPVPGGPYMLCGEALPQFTFAAKPGLDGRPLDSCAWLDGSSARVTVAAGELRSGIKLTLKQGRLLTIRVNDPQKLLPPAKGRNSGNELSLHITAPNGFVRRIPILEEDANGRTHGIVIPYDSPHKLSIQSTAFSLQDQASREFSAAAPLSVQSSRGTPGPQYVVTVKAKGAK